MREGGVEFWLEEGEEEVEEVNTERVADWEEMSVALEVVARLGVGKDRYYVGRENVGLIVRYN